MTRGLVAESGRFRSGSVGVVDNDGRVLHFGTLPAYVPQLVGELVEWVCDSDYPILLKSCVFHYELELIHPFADGNGRIGRLWHTLLLSKWKPFFAWLPVESIIHDRRQEYYNAINRSNAGGESTAFIEFMLSAIQAALEDAVSVEAPHKHTTIETQRWREIEAFLRENETISNSDVRELFRVSGATANRILAKLVADDKLKKLRLGRSWGYKPLG